MCAHKTAIIIIRKAKKEGKTNKSPKTHLLALTHKYKNCYFFHFFSVSISFALLLSFFCNYKGVFSGIYSSCHFVYRRNGLVFSLERTKPKRSYKNKSKSTPFHFRSRITLKFNEQYYINTALFYYVKHIHVYH